MFVDTTITCVTSRSTELHITVDLLLFLKHKALRKNVGRRKSKSPTKSRAETWYAEYQIFYLFLSSVMQLFTGLTSLLDWIRLYNSIVTNKGPDIYFLVFFPHNNSKNYGTELAAILNRSWTNPFSNSFSSCKKPKEYMYYLYRESSLCWDSPGLTLISGN